LTPIYCEVFVSETELFVHAEKVAFHQPISWLSSILQLVLSTANSWSTKRTIDHKHHMLCHTECSACCPCIRPFQHINLLPGYALVDNTTNCILLSCYVIPVNVTKLMAIVALTYCIVIRRLRPCAFRLHHNWKITGIIYMVLNLDSNY
jgi:hypothetical protein